jgi:hypothetical protein
MKAFFIDCHVDYWINIATKFKEKYDWEIKYWVGKSINKSKILSSFPNIVFHDVMDAVKGISPIEINMVKLPAIDKKVLQEYSHCESIALKMMDRVAELKEFHYYERIRSYHKLLQYWLGIVEFFKPEIIIRPTSPHLVYDYILYEICLKKDIKTVMFVRTSINGKVFPINTIDQPIVQFPLTRKRENRKTEPSENGIQDQLSEYVQKINGTYENGKPYHVKFKNKKAQIDNLFVFMLQRIYGLIRSGIPRNYVRLPDEKLDNYTASKLKYLKYELRGKLHRKYLKKQYARLSSSKIDLTKPFVFVALQCQPERSTSPDGEYFVHQNLMVELISKSIPDNWNIYAKEHLSQFKDYQRAEKSRDKLYYKELLRIPKVKLVSLNYTSFELIDAAKAVGVITGTVGIETLIRGKPVLLFGHAWYKGCEGVFLTTDWNSCKKAIKKIKSGYQVNHSQVISYLYTVMNTGYNAYVDIIYGDLLNISEEENANTLFTAIQSNVYN